MNESEKFAKICENCYHYIEPFKNEPNIPYCGIDGLSTKFGYSCPLYEQNYALNKYALCSASECLSCQYFKKESNYCMLGKK